MKIAIFIKKASLRSDPRLLSLERELSGCEMYLVGSEDDLHPDTDMLLSVGGDGTFLSAARILAGRDIPVLGVNLGRLGFLSENRPEDIAEPLLRGEYVIEDREMLSVSENGGVPRAALNEVCVKGMSSSMLGVDVSIDGVALPTCWADGMLVATSSGSTAYALSVGGPICTPDSSVLIIAPIAPHNLNVRPLIVPATATVQLSVHSRQESVALSLDNCSRVVPSDVKLDVSVAQFSLKRVRLPKSDFIGALKSKLFWGEDVRNEIE